MIDAKVQQEFEEYFAMFALPGYKRYIKDITDAVENMKEQLVSNTDSNALHFIRGQISAQRFHINMENGLKLAYEQLLKEDVEDAEV